MKNKINSLVIVLLIVIFSISLRMHTFYLPHNHGDQVSFLGLAMKLDKFGLKGYNLNGIDVKKVNHLLEFSPMEGKGVLLESFEKDNVFYYSKEILSNMPPAFSFLMMLSHKLFASHAPYLSVNSNLGPFAIFIRPDFFLKAQFYAVWPNFLFSILFILLVFILGKLFFSENVGLWASILVATSPVDILTSQRLWTDEMVSFFTILCVIFFWLGFKKDKIYYFVLSGIMGGLAGLTKQSGVFIIIILALSFLLINLKEKGMGGLSFKNIFDKRLMFFILSAFFVCFFWYYKITAIYGSPWYMPYQPGIEKVSSWFILLSKRPRYGQFYYFVYLSPLFLFFYVESVKIIFRKIFTPERIICLTWFFVHIIFLVIIPAKEERYMLPVYPSIAIISALSLEKIRVYLNNYKGGGNLGNLITVLLLFLVSAWSINLGLGAVFSNTATFDVFN